MKERVNMMNSDVMKMTTLITCSLLLIPSLLAATGDYMAQQAYDETRRLAGQVDVIQNNVDDHAARLSKLEHGNGNAALQARVAALEASNAELRRKIENLRNEIVADLTKKIKSIQQTPAPAPKPVVTGPCKEYVVQSGDTLSLIAEAFNTKVSTLRQMNGLKNDNLRVGQKINVPMEK